MICIRSVAGLEHAKIVRNAYAIEYDCIRCKTVKAVTGIQERLKGCSAADSSMEVPVMKKLHAQGLIAGINAARKLQKKRSSCTGSIPRHILAF